MMTKIVTYIQLRLWSFHSSSFLVPSASCPLTLPSKDEFVLRAHPEILGNLTTYLFKAIFNKTLTI